MNNDAELKNWTFFYLKASTGGFLSGMLHNMHNYIHALRMQAELIEQKSKLLTVVDAEQSSKYLSRIKDYTNSLSQYCQELDHRSFYIQNGAAQINIKEFIYWLMDFWNNNLFYKHQIKCKLNLSEKAPGNVKVQPFLLTYCLEAAFQNAIEACRAQGLDSSYELYFNILPFEQGLCIELISPTQLDSEIDPWLKGSTSKENNLGIGLYLVRCLCKKVGWKVDLYSLGQQTKYELKIPEVQTRTFL